MENLWAMRELSAMQVNLASSTGPHVKDTLKFFRSTDQPTNADGFFPVTT